MLLFIPAEELILSLLRTTEKPRYFLVAELVRIFAVEVFQQSASQIVGFPDVNELPEALQLVDAGSLRNDIAYVIFRCVTLSLILDRHISPETHMIFSL